MADAVRREHSLGVCVRRFAAGSVPVFAVGDESLARWWFAP